MTKEDPITKESHDSESIRKTLLWILNDLDFDVSGRIVAMRLAQFGIEDPHMKGIMDVHKWGQVFQEHVEGMPSERLVMYWNMAVYAWGYDGIQLVFEMAKQEALSVCWDLLSGNGNVGDDSDQERRTT